jgi:DNA-directed RNA polymerase subunit RPC12/RpoP
MPEKRPLTRNDWMTIGFLALFIVALLASALVIPSGPYGAFLFLLVAVAGLYGLVSWHSGHYAYTCKSCGQKFTIGFWQDFLAPHTTRAQYLKCPHCGKRTWASETNRE